jgi:hypothetical protein
MDTDMSKAITSATLSRILRAADLRAQAAIALVAFSGLTTETVRELRIS